MTIQILFNKLTEHYRIFSNDFSSKGHKTLDIAIKNFNANKGIELSLEKYIERYSSMENTISDLEIYDMEINSLPLDIEDVKNKYPELFL